MAGGLAVWALRSFDLRALVGTLSLAGWIQILFLVIGAAFLSILPSWLFLRLAGHRMPYLGFTGVMLASQALNVANPLRMGFPLRVYLLNARFGVPAAMGSLLIPLEALMAFLVAISLGLLAAPLYTSVLGARWITGLVAAIIVGATAITVAVKLAEMGRLPVPSALRERATRILGPLKESLRKITLGSLLVFAVAYLFSDLAAALILKLSLHEAGFDASVVYLVCAYCAAYAFGTLSFMPQGLGTRDAMLGFLLHAAGATPEQAAYGALIHRTATTGLSFVLGILAAWAMGLSRRGPVPRDTDAFDTVGLGVGPLPPEPRRQGGDARR